MQPTGFALDNASEGCVRELYGAAVATWQSTHAHVPQIREGFGADIRLATSRQ
jgi:hypothetical protein